jgi:AcrR family transcriptional regulator
MAKGPQLESPNARERILSTAEDVIARRGYTAAGVQEIVTLSGTSKGSFYFHFPSKEQMVMALFERMSQKLINKVYRTIEKEPSPLHRVAASIDTLMAVFAGKRTIAHVLLLNIAGNGKDIDRKFLPIREKFSALIQQELDAAVAAGQIRPVDTALVARMWVGSIREVIYDWLLTGKPSTLTLETPALRTTLLMSIGAADPRERTTTRDKGK